MAFKGRTKWISFAKLNHLSILILRLSEYGPGRSAFDRIYNKSFKIVKVQIFYFKIHIDDITSIIKNL